MSDETDALSDMASDEELDGYMDDEDREEQRVMLYEQKVQEMEGLYNLAKMAKIGDKILCPNCSRKFIKKTKDHTFCSNQRQIKGKSSCKDQYWNTVDFRKNLYVRKG